MLFGGPPSEFKVPATNSRRAHGPSSEIVGEAILYVGAAVVGVAVVGAAVVGVANGEAVLYVGAAVVGVLVVGCGEGIGWNSELLLIQSSPTRMIIRHYDKLGRRPRKICTHHFDNPPL